MEWDRISGNWETWRSRVQERWSKLTDDQLAVIAGRRERLAAHIQRLYGLSPVEAERQLRNWQRNLGVQEFDEADLVVDDDDDEAMNTNGRG